MARFEDAEREFWLGDNKAKLEWWWTAGNRPRPFPEPKKLFARAYKLGRRYLRPFPNWEICITPELLGMGATWEDMSHVAYGGRVRVFHLSRDLRIVAEVEKIRRFPALEVQYGFRESRDAVQVERRVLLYLPPEMWREVVKEG
ncbi:hypothetical protein DRZ78_01670 [Candidatus Aerophobetes bacterium]|uniref:Uncharacterized protein n=1 Tax=Aerophobetes bacterium TaxID=2030807 RepID=A0A662D0Z5_UNCAE|nr:MAG: hypothetical protein DRZ78_01670 [Candidatus Aerophobetes bacterium]